MARTVADRVGEVYTVKGKQLKIVEYNSKTDVVVEWLDSFHYRTHTTMQHIRNERVKNPYTVTVNGVGCLGNIDIKVVENGKRNRHYNIWLHMLTRCYDTEYQRKYSLVEQVEVCDRWKCFEYFLEDVKQLEGYHEWLESDNMVFDYEIKQQYDYDKEIKVYAPDTCMFVNRAVKKMMME